MSNFRRGQSTLEYVIILAVVIGAIILVGVVVKGNLKSSYTDLGNKMQSKVGQVTF
jgi:Flp pilus assembly pilin Flp